ncbi:alpha/beta fold hydrolase [Roseomonas sp. WA12]
MSVIALGILTLALAFTVRGTLSLTMPAWQTEVGWSRGFISGTAACALLVMALPAPFAGGIAWRSRPSFCAVSTEDRTINPDLQRFMASRMGARTVELRSSHVSLLSHPRSIADLVLEAAGR